jgi:hypothetical protein
MSYYYDFCKNKEQAIMFSTEINSQKLRRDEEYRGVLERIGNKMRQRIENEESGGQSGGEPFTDFELDIMIEIAKNKIEQFNVYEHYKFPMFLHYQDVWREIISKIKNLKRGDIGGKKRKLHKTKKRRRK